MSDVLMSEFDTSLINAYVMRQTNHTQGAILKHSCSVERLIKQIRQNVA